ncbi:EAL domain-containing protein [Allorhizobium sp. BGMRC 0089]|uniref:putative bifunctional diguanylate cyclase/phosphodiesterase n=1 Tax=Allorhizobium sonneratiae TaxID=2934936 RepID=UPI002033A8F8|nr:EAL domain-containing protein [Allorhizobium sonneratiae]MCM2293589.1 EAL domain-containing protein [Allorhizobium sonneratiae]
MQYWLKCWWPFGLLRLRTVTFVKRLYLVAGEVLRGINLFSGLAKQTDMTALAAEKIRAKVALSARKFIFLDGLSALLAIVALMVLLERNDVAFGCWLVAALAVTVLRYTISRTFLYYAYDSRYPRVVLRFMVAVYGVHGALWAMLPTIVVPIDLLQSGAAVLVLMGGLIGTVLCRQTGASAIALAFAMPIILALIYQFACHGGFIGIVSAINMGLIGLVMALVNIRSDRRFVEGEMAKLRLESYAQTLASVNEDIRHKNIRLEALANGDSVTGLKNRLYFTGQLNGALAAARVSSQSVALLLIDVDRFQTVNTIFGQRGGDHYLAVFGQRIQSAAGSYVTTARISGDTFAVLIRHDKAKEQAISLACRLLDEQAMPVVVHGTSVQVSASIGLACFPDDADDADRLIAAANLALGEAKTQGRKQFRQFNPDLKRKVDRQHAIEQDLQAAIDNGTIETWFQPQIHLETGRIVGFEALIRWFHPEFGSIAPPDIINAAYAMQLSERLTTGIACQTALFLQRLQSLDLPEATVAINISPREFALYDVAHMLNEVTLTYGVERHLLEVEITEEAILNPDIAGPQLERLDMSGYKLAIDDFGVGYSSLAYLIGLKIARLKIDRSFVTDVVASDANKALIVALVGLGKTLGIEIVVEGVEDTQQLSVLQHMGCAIGQGFFFARPMPSDRVPNWLEQYRQTQMPTKPVLGRKKRTALAG